MRNIDITDSSVSVDQETVAEAVEQVSSPSDTVDRDDRLAAGRTLRTAAKADPNSIEPHVDKLRTLLDDEFGPVRLTGAVCLAKFASVDPEAVGPFAPSLVDLLETSGAPAVQMAALEALAEIGKYDSSLVTTTDTLVATKLRTGSLAIRNGVVTTFVGAVVESPTQYPETVHAIEDALMDEATTVRKRAASAIAAVAEVNPDVIHSLEDVRERTESLAASTHPLQDENLTRAAHTLHSLEEK